MQSKVTAIVVYKDYYQNFENCISSLLNQTYKNIEIVVVNESKENGDKAEKKLQNILLLHPEIKLADVEKAGVVSRHLLAAENIDSNYLIFIRFAEVLTKDYIFNAVKAIGTNMKSMAISKISFYFPKETIAELYAYEKQDYQIKKDSLAATFLNGSKVFWGYYCLDNKLIGKELWDAVLGRVK